MSPLQPGLHFSLGFLFEIALFLGICYTFWIPFYNIFLHPLRKYPGPKSWAASRLPYAYMILGGESHKQVLRLHQKYGDVVRIAPDELSYLNPAAWNEIMGHRKRGQEENGKDPAFWKTLQHSVISANREDHSRMRRVLSHGFSAQSMLDQQSIIHSYVDLLVQRLKENCDDGNQLLEMTSWYNWTTFDIIGDLAFGESFGCLDSSSYHPWVSLIFDRIRGNAINTVLRRFPFGNTLIRIMVPSRLRRNFHAHFELTKEKVGKRLKAGDPRPDFMEVMIKKDGNFQLSQAELFDNASLLIIAGSETTATTLSGVTFLLSSHPEVMAKVVEEVRTSFAHESEIDLLSVQKLNYMQAVLNETLRMYPPVPAAIPRTVHAGGDTLCGRYVPPETIVGIWQWPLYHSDRNFSFPEQFIPERWLDDPRFDNDSKDAFQPFSFGPRNCIGKNLAFAEMRLILAKVLWNFDFQVDEKSRDWLSRNKAFSLWQKPDLYARLTPRR